MAGVGPAAAASGVAIVGQWTWSRDAGGYSALFELCVSEQPYCVFLAGLAQNNGAQLISDKVAVLGANGAGKRSMLRAISGLVASAGDVHFAVLSLLGRHAVQIDPSSSVDVPGYLSVLP